MKVLGLSYGYHDASAALVVDGHLVASAREENQTRQKHDAFFPQFAIKACLGKAGLDLSEIDKVAYYENTEKKFSRVLSSSLKKWPRSQREFNTSVLSWLGGKLWTEAKICHYFNLEPKAFCSFDHHQSHAAQAFIGSEYQQAAILTIDAVGEWETMSQYFAKWEQGRPQFTKCGNSLYPHSLGLFYSAITDYLGFKPMSDECSTMALAAFGDNQWVEKMRECIKINSNGQIEINEKYFQFDRYFHKPYTKEFVKIFGPPSTSTYDFSSFQKMDIQDESIRWANIALAAQKVFEECVIQLAKNLKEQTGAHQLCLAGGGALNCVANTALLKESGFTEIYIPKDPGDGGAAIGAAYLAYFKENKVSSMTYRDAISHGLNYKTEDLIEVIQAIKPRALQKYKKKGSLKNYKEKWEVQECHNSQELTQRTASLIDRGQVIAWYQQGVECGPRALGYRSILFKADDVDLAKRVSATIKDRASFRPYALSMTDQWAERILQPIGLDPSRANEVSSLKPLRYMQLAVEVNPYYIQKLRGGLHIDLTTRPQVVFQSDHPLYYQLLEDYSQLSGIGSFINTSFNESGYPIVETPYDALLMFARTDIEVLVINNLIIKKKGVTIE